MNGIWQHRRSQGLTGFERSGRMCELYCGKCGQSVKRVKEGRQR